MGAVAKPWRRVLLVAAIVFLGLVLLAVSLRLAASGPPGRWAVERFGNGIELGGYGELTFADVSGDVMSRFTIGRLQISDAEGVWLSARSIAVEWSPDALARRRLEIAVVTVREIDLVRSPVRADREVTGDGPSISVRLERLAVDALHLGEAVIGQAATLRLASEFELAAGGELAFTARAIRTDAPGDSAALDLSRSAEGAITATLRAEGAAGGPLAALLRAPDQPVVIDGNAEGHTQAGAGGVVLRFGSERAGDIAVRWRDGDFVAEGWIAPLQWPEAAEVRAYFDDTVRFEGSGRYAGGFELSEATFRAPDLEFLLAPDGPEAWRLAATVSGGRLYPLTGGRVEADDAMWTGRVTLSGGLDAEGVLTARNVAYLGFGAESVTGPLAVTGSFAQPELTADLALMGATYPDPALARALGPSPRTRLRTEWAREGGRFDVAHVEFINGDSRIAGVGAVYLEEDRYAFEAEFELAGLEVVTDAITGRAAGRATLAGGFDGGVELAVEGRVSRLAGSEWFERLGESAQVSASGVRARDGVLTLSHARLEMRNLLAEWTAGWEPGGQWRAEGDAAVTAGVVLGPLEAEGGVAIAFDARDAGDGLVWRLEAGAGTLSAGGVALEDPALRIEGRGSDDFGADLRLTAITEHGDIDLSGRIVRENAVYRLEALTGSAGPIVLSGTGDADEEGVSAVARARWNGDAGAPDITADVAFDSDGADGALDARLTVGPWYFGTRGGRLDSLSLTAAGDLDAIVVTLAASGAYGEPWRLDANGEFGFGADGWFARLTPSGEIAGFRLAAESPFEARSTETGFQGEAAWTLGGGRFAITGARENGVNTLQAAIDDAPAELVAIIRPWMRPEGAVDARLSYLRSETVAEGDFHFTLRGLNPAGADPRGALDLVIEAGLRDGRFVATADGGGGGLVLDGSLSADIGPGRGVTDIRDASQAPVRGRLSIAGPIGALGGFHLPESQTIGGVIETETTIAGTIGAPEFSGVMRLTNGSFRDVRQGVRIAAANAEGRFSGDGVTLDSLTATDGDRGTLSGSGRISFADARASGEINASWRNFRILDRPDLEAVATGNAAITIGAEGRIDVSGESVLDRVEARPPQSSQAGFVEIDVIEVNLPPGSAPPPVSPVSRIHLDYRVSAPGRVYMRGPSFDTEWSMDIRVRGPSTAPKLVGMANLERGEAVLIGRRFAFVSGVVRFNGLPETGRVDMTAERAGADLTARINVSGPLSAPVITLSSQPALPQDEILARILFDRSTGSLSALEAAQLAALISNTAGGGGAFAAFDRVRTLAGIDRLSVRSGADGSPIVSGGRYIDEDVYLEIESGVNGAATSAARIEWELWPNITLVSRLTGSTDASISLRWRREFD